MLRSKDREEAGSCLLPLWPWPSTVEAKESSPGFCACQPGQEVTGLQPPTPTPAFSFGYWQGPDFPFLQTRSALLISFCSPHSLQFLGLPELSLPLSLHSRSGVTSLLPG